MAKIADEEEKEKLIENFRKKEIDFLNLKRIKMSIDDFKSIKLIGKGAFGLVQYNKKYIKKMSCPNSFIL